MTTKQKQKQTKLKAWREQRDIDPTSYFYGCCIHSVDRGNRNKYTCTVVPDGAPMPMDAATRRLVRAALEWHSATGRANWPARDTLMDACDKYMEEKARRGEGNSGAP